MEKYAEIIKAAGEKTRLRIVRLLLEAKVPLCVCEMMDCLKESQTNISKHLKILRYAGIVKEERKGKWSMYSLSSSSDKFLNLLFNAIEAIPSKRFEKENRCLKKRLGLRKNGEPVIGIRRKKC
ncbi:MAG TPA: metalloregulator ArsR/SmtB family transcription factor [bacterium]|nr:metalloregulator ArsR/SmtB family transcription factor [bacterium]HPP30203.1 metalloregulator ArsR/SmtB family transcription factor [bacterium]